MPEQMPTQDGPLPNKNDGPAGLHSKYVDALDGVLLGIGSAPCAAGAPPFVDLLRREIAAGKPPVLMAANLLRARYSVVLWLRQHGVLIDPPLFDYSFWDWTRERRDALAAAGLSAKAVTFFAEVALLVLRPGQAEKLYPAERRTSVAEELARLERLDRVGLVAGLLMVRSDLFVGPPPTAGETCGQVERAAQAIKFLTLVEPERMEGAGFPPYQAMCTPAGAAAAIRRADDWIRDVLAPATDPIRAPVGPRLRAVNRLWKTGVDRIRKDGAGSVAENVLNEFASALQAAGEPIAKGKMAEAITREAKVLAFMLEQGNGRLPLYRIGNMLHLSPHRARDIMERLPGDRRKRRARKRRQESKRAGAAPEEDKALAGPDFPMSADDPESLSGGASSIEDRKIDKPLEAVLAAEEALAVRDLRAEIEARGDRAELAAFEYLAGDESRAAVAERYRVTAKALLCAQDRILPQLKARLHHLSG